MAKGQSAHLRNEESISVCYLELQPRFQNMGAINSILETDFQQPIFFLMGDLKKTNYRKLLS